MVKKQVVKKQSIPSWRFLRTLLRTHCFFIQALCFLKNIGMALVSLFMDRGTEHPKCKKDIWLALFLLRTESPQVNGKFLPTILLAWNRLRLLVRRNTGPAVLHKVRMEHCMCPMM